MPSVTYVLKQNDTLFISFPPSSVLMRTVSWGKEKKECGFQREQNPRCLLQPLKCPNKPIKRCLYFDKAIGGTKKPRF